MTEPEKELRIKRQELIDNALNESALAIKRAAELAFPGTFGNLESERTQEIISKESLNYANKALIALFYALRKAQSPTQDN